MQSPFRFRPSSRMLFFVRYPTFAIAGFRCIGHKDNRAGTAARLFSAVAGGIPLTFLP